MNAILKLVIFLIVFFFSAAASATLFQVGPTRIYTVPSKVINLVSDGDTVEIDAGLYSGDVGTWTKNNLFIRCPNGMAHLDAAGQNAGGKAIWVISGKNAYIENIEFSGCSVADHNGAGIRQEGDNLELRHCYFHDNDDGILTDASATSDILFEACEFAHNGYGDGFSHNMYIGNIHSFTMRFCYSHQAKVGHCVKSRAMNNFIEYNRIMDEDSGSASYLINLPNGGFSIVLGNSMMKGPNAQNRTLVDYGSEEPSNPIRQLYVVNNTMVSTRTGGATFVSVGEGTDTTNIINNIFAGNGIIVNGKADTTTNVFSPDINYFSFTNTSVFDYHIVNSPKDLLYGTLPGFTDSHSLMPIMEYVHPLDSIARSNYPLNIGAFQIHIADVSESNGNISYNNYPNPFTEKTTINLGSINNEAPLTIHIYNQLGAEIQSRKYFSTNSQIIFERGKLNSGMYYYVVVNSEGKNIIQGKFILD